MKCQVCDKPFELNEGGRPVGRFVAIKGWSKSDETYNASFRSLDVHRDCVYEILEKAGVSLRKLIG